MKKLISFVLTAVSIICVCSCGNQSSSDLQAKVDSLQTALSQRDADYRTLDEFVNVISTGLDSIAIQETELFNPSKESPTPSQEQIKKQLSHFKETLQSQRERIAELEKKLGNSEGNGKKLQRIVIAMKAQLEEKESELAVLRQELEAKDIHIAELDEQVSQLNEDVVMLKDENAQKTETIGSQDKELHTAWYVFGTKRELKEQNILKSGEVLQGNFNKNYFTKIDIRVDKEIKLMSRDARILTNHPAGTYTLERDANKQYVLRITNPQQFWSTSKYLVVQVK